MLRFKKNENELKAKENYFKINEQKRFFKMNHFLFKSGKFFIRNIILDICLIDKIQLISL